MAHGAAPGSIGRDGRGANGGAWVLFAVSRLVVGPRSCGLAVAIVVHRARGCHGGRGLSWSRHGSTVVVASELGITGSIQVFLHVVLTQNLVRFGLHLGLEGHFVVVHDGIVLKVGSVGRH
jgi:hypothetical protein